MMLKYFLAWFGLMVLAIINGAIRDFAYTKRVWDLAAHQISTAVFLVLLTGCFWVLTSVWPIATAGQAWAIGGMWFLMTEAFEFGMGRFIRRLTGTQLLRAYDLREGQVWVLIPLCVLVGPYVFYQFVQAG